LTVNGVASNPLSFTVTNTASNPTMTGFATHFDGLGSPFRGCGLPQSVLDSQDFVALNVQNTPGTTRHSSPAPFRRNSRVRSGYSTTGETAAAGFR
jgi:hypothetical protein